MSRIRIGDEVTWQSQSQGVIREKSGVVAAQVPAGKTPTDPFVGRVRGTRSSFGIRDSFARRAVKTAKSIGLDSVSFKPLSDGGARESTSFLVVSKDGQVYWPYAELLQKN